MSSKKPISANNINVSGDFIAGDQYNYYYTGDFASLAEYYISPEAVFQRVRTDDFIGRDWLTAKVDAFLNNPNRKSGAFLLIGDAGVGKTSFMAHLVKERRYLHLFAEQVPGQAMVTRALQSLESQLITRYQIDPYHDRDTLNALADSPDFLERILRYAVEKLAVGEKIVIVCDALDEAGVGKNEFVFGLPKELPDGVYFILSQRPVNVKLPNFEPVIEKLEAQGEGNMQDMQAYLSAVAKRPEVAGQIRSKEYSEELFIQTLKEKSQGVWMYLHYIIKEIESGARAPLDLANLPTGLVGYYAEYWDAWRTGKRGKGEEAWDDLYAPLLTTLAAAQEAIPVDWLMQWADITAKPREVIRLLTEHWRAFITEKDVNGQRAYIPYHLSFKDFITGRVDTDKLPPAQANLVKDLAAQTVDAHKRIVRTFEKECNGEWEKLVEQEYPRLHLTAHLNGAGEYEKLRILLTEGDEKIKWAEARERKEETYAGYLNDLSFVWDYAEREQNYSLAVRCMLTENSIHSLAENIPPELLAKLAETGRWSYARCLIITRQYPNYIDQEKSLRLIAHLIPQQLHQEVIYIAKEIKDEIVQIEVLLHIAPYLTKELKNQVFVLINGIQDELIRIKGLSEFTPYLTSEIRQETIKIILAAVFEIEDELFCSEVLALLIPKLNGKLKSEVLPKIISIAKDTQDEFSRIHLLSALSQYLSDEQKTEFLHEVLYSAKKQSTQFPVAFSALVPYLNDKQKKHSLSIVREFGDDYVRVYALSQIIPHLTEAIASEVVQEAITAIDRIEDVFMYTMSISEIVYCLNPKLQHTILQNALLATGNIKDEELQTIVLSKLIPFLNESQKEQVMSFIVPEIKYEPARVTVLAALGAQLQGDLKLLVLDLIYKIQDKRLKSNTLTDLSQYLSEENKNQVIQDALLFSREIKDQTDYIAAALGVSSFLKKEFQPHVYRSLIALVQEIDNKEEKLQILLILAPYLESGFLNQMCQEVLLIINVRKIKKIFIHGLPALMPYVADDLKFQILQIAYGFEDMFDRVNAMSSIIPHLKGYIKEQTVQDALSFAYKIDSHYFRALALSKVAPSVSSELKFEILQNSISVAREINDEVFQSIAFIKIARNANDEAVTLNILATAQKIKSFVSYSRVLSAFAEHLDKSLVDDIFSKLHDIENETIRVEVLINLIPCLKREKQILFLQDLLYFRDSSAYIKDILSIWEIINYEGLLGCLEPLITFSSQKNRKAGMGVVSALTPALVHFRGPEIADELYRTITDVTRWWP